MLYLLISFSFGNNAPKSDAPLPDTASKALLRQIDEACEKREEGKTNARLWSDRAGTVGKRSWGRRNPEGEGEKQQEGLAPSLGVGEGWPVMGMGFG